DTVENGIRHFGRGQAFGVAEFTPPELFEFSLVFRVGNALIIGIGRGHEANIGGALNVVLSANRVQTGTSAPDVAGHQRQRDQAAYIVGAVHALRTAHTPDDH